MIMLRSADLSRVSFWLPITSPVSIETGTNHNTELGELMENDIRQTSGPLFRMIENHMRAAAIRWTRWRNGEVEDRPEMLRYCSRLRQHWTSGVMGATLRREDARRAVEETLAWFEARNSPWTWWI